MANKVLIVEDERAIVEILKFNLNREGYETLEALDGETGLELGRTADPDLILLDVMLPKLGGFEICRRLRDEGSTVPILMLTAREEENDKVFGLEAGADDYITKPFSMRELLARVKANIRRRSLDGSERPASGELTLDEEHFVAAKGGVLSMTYGMSRRLAPYKITVNAVCPGTIETEIIRQWTPEKIQELTSNIPLGTLGKAEDIAQAVAFLAADENDFITGEAISVNGGMYCG